MAKNQSKIQEYENFTKFKWFQQPLVELNSFVPILMNLDFCHPFSNELGQCAGVALASFLRPALL